MNTIITRNDFPQQLHQRPIITIYGPHDCPNCDKATQLFDRKQIHYTKIDIVAGDSNHRFVKDELGYQTAPVIIVDFDETTRIHWGGHRMDMLMGLARFMAKPLCPATSDSDEKESA